YPPVGHLLEGWEARAPLLPAPLWFRESLPQSQIRIQGQKNQHNGHGIRQTTGQTVPFQPRKQVARVSVRVMPICKNLQAAKCCRWWGKQGQRPRIPPASTNLL